MSVWRTQLSMREYGCTRGSVATLFRRGWGAVDSGHAPSMVVMCRWQWSRAVDSGHAPLTVVTRRWQWSRAVDLDESQSRRRLDRSLRVPSTVMGRRGAAVATHAAHVPATWLMCQWRILGAPDALYTPVPLPATRLTSTGPVRSYNPSIHATNTVI